MTARAAPAIWPYPHRTLAEVFAAEDGWRSGARGKHKTPADPINDDRLRSPLPASACPYCQSRGWCGHAGRVAA